MARRLVAIADDFTGACEVAGAALRGRIHSVVTMATPVVRLPEDLQVIDTETRLARASHAASALRAIGRTLAKEADLAIFKKVDSVFRGSVRAELEATANALGCGRIILVCANPLAGRIIRGGQYAIQNKPLHETVFAEDPYHPARSSDVRELLGTKGKFEVHAALTPLDVLPETGILIGDATSVTDLDQWSRSSTSNTLFAGSAAFFESWLARQDIPTAAPLTSPTFSAPSLLISGTTVAEQRSWLRSVPGAIGLPLDTLDNIDPWTHRIVERLSQGHSTVVYVDGPVTPSAAVGRKISAALAQVASLAAQVGAARHLVVEGGETAAAILRRVRWESFETLFEWRPGVVTLRPKGNENCFLTVKPGSYPWPESLLSPFSHYMAPALSR